MEQPAVGQGYAICCDARAGSSFLCRVLASTGRLGDPKEYFHERAGVRHILRRPGGLAEVLAAASTPNGVFGLKVFAPHFDLSRRLGWSGLPGLSFVHLTRDDLLGQAISLTRARQTRQYKSFEEEAAKPRYDGKAIVAALAELAYGRARWECFFARNGIHFLRLGYEEVVARPQAAAEAVADLIELPEPVVVDLAALALDVQRDALSEAWRVRFVSEQADRGYLDAGRLAAVTTAPTRFARLFLGA